MYYISILRNLKQLDIRDCVHITSGTDLIMQGCNEIQVIRMRSANVSDEMVQPILSHGVTLSIRSTSLYKSQF